MPFDSREYEWADVSVVVSGRDITGIRGIKYSEKIEREPLYAKGRFPHSIQSGNVSYEGSVTVLQSELNALISAGSGSLLKLRNLSVTVGYGDATNGDVVTTDRLSGVYFTESPKELKQGDKNMEIELPIVFTQLEPNI